MRRFRPNRPPAALLFALAALLLGLLGGYGLGRLGPAESTAQDAAPPAEQPAGADEFALLRELRGLIQGEYYRPTATDSRALLHGAARGMITALNDPNSVYETPEEREANDSRWTGRYEGVGMYVDQRDGLMVVTAPIEGGPAEKAGVRPGDVVLEINGQPAGRLTLAEQTRLLRGPKGTSVALTVRREGQAGPLSITILRDEVRLISARGRLLDSGLGVLRISQFTEGTPRESRAALDGLLAAHPSGLLLDLRGNAGGLLEPAVTVAGYFLGGGPVVMERHADGEEKSYSAPDGQPLTELPMLVLVDRGSASASEIMAAALRDRGRAELIGERTYGKNTVQYIHRLSDGSGVRLTVAEWRTPSGQPIPSTGLDPDTPVATPSPVPTDRDPVLDSAAQRLLSRVAAGAQGGGAAPAPAVR